MTYSPIIIKFIQMDKLPWELQKETISGIRTALNLAECDLVRFRVWITKVNTGKTDERPIKPVLDAMPAGTFASNLTDESLMIVAMAPVDGDGIDFLKSGLYQTEEKISAVDDQHFQTNLFFFVQFLIDLRKCLERNRVTFSDMKLANVGYILKNGNVQWRLLDLDGINGKSLTFPYTFWRGRDLWTQTRYAMGVTVARYLAPKLGIEFGQSFFPATFKPNECNMVLGEFLLPSIKLLKNWSRTPIPIFFRIFKRVLAADGRFYWSIARHSFRRGRPAARGPPQSRRRGRRQKDCPESKAKKDKSIFGD